MESPTDVCGTGEAGSTVTVRDEDGVVLGEATVDDDGNFCVSTTFEDGDHTVTATQSTPGQEDQVSDPIDFTVDTNGDGNGDGNVTATATATGTAATGATARTARTEGRQGRGYPVTRTSPCGLGHRAAWSGTGAWRRGASQETLDDG